MPTGGVGGGNPALVQDGGLVIMPFPSLQIGNLTAKVPVIQGGMGVGISLSGLASAVANQGGIGVIAGAMIGMKEPDVAKNPLEANLRALRNEIIKARELSNGIIGVNVARWPDPFSQMVRTAIENKADIIFSGVLGPLEMPRHLLQLCEERRKEFKTKLVPIVSSARAATVIAKNGSPVSITCRTHLWWKAPRRAAIWVSNPKKFRIPHALEVLVPQVVDAVKPR